MTSPCRECHPSISLETLNYLLQSHLDSERKCVSTGKVVPKAVYLKQLPSYTDFFEQILFLNQLCVLTPETTKQWRCRNEWVCCNGKPNFDFLQQAFGEATVPVADCRKKEFSGHAKKQMKMKDFLDYWRKYDQAGCPCSGESLYLKDWHFTRDFPDYDAYSTCSFFRSDWLNEFWDKRGDVDDDYRFVYMGPKGTWTPFHADVFRSFSWSANICGRKRWIFYPPGEEEHLKDINGNLVYDITSEELQDKTRFPNACKAAHRIEVIQNPGETIFVPSGWHHQVENLEDTISVNHNWLNGCNIQQCWLHLKISLLEVEHEISDCRGMEGWEQQCQLILRAYAGMDYTEFFHFMCCIARNRIQSLDIFKKQHLVLHANINMHSEIVENFPDSSCNETNSETQSESAPCCFKEDTIFVSLEAIPTHIVSTLSELSVNKHYKYIQEADPAEQQWEAPNKYSPREPFSCHTSAVASCSEGFHRVEWDKTKSYRLCKCPGKRTSPLPTSVCFESVLVLSESLTACKNKRRLPHWAKCSVSHALFDLTKIHSILNEMACRSFKNLLTEKKRKKLEALSESIQDVLLNFGIKFKKTV